MVSHHCIKELSLEDLLDKLIILVMIFINHSFNPNNHSFIHFFQCVIACVSPKYVVSHHCIKELALADLLHKPIIPVMIDKVAWPPPGGMSLIFSQLVYINLKGKFKEITSTYLCSL